MGPQREKPWLCPWRTHKMSLHQDTKVRSNGWQASCVTNPLLLHPAVFNTLGSFSHSLKCGFAYWLPNPQESLSSPGPLSFSKLEKNKKQKSVCSKSYNYWIWFSFELFLSDMTARLFGRWQAPRLQSVCEIKNMLLGCVCVCACAVQESVCVHACMY